jgi:hypothetical protein
MSANFCSIGHEFNSCGETFLFLFFLLFHSLTSKYTCKCVQIVKKKFLSAEKNLILECRKEFP